MKQEFREHLQWVVTAFTRNILKTLWVFPLKKNKILCNAFVGRQYACSPKYLTEYLLKHADRHYEIIWLSTNPKKQHIKGIKFVKYLSLKHFLHFCTARLIIENGGMPTYLPKRKGQYLINTWHGGGAYKGTYRQENDSYRQKLKHYKSARTDLMLSSSRVFTEKAIPDILPDYNGEIMNCGMPRNDLLMSTARETVKQKIRVLFGIDKEAKVILYAPTVRGVLVVGRNGLDSKSNYTFNIDVQHVIHAVEKRFGKSAVLLFRQHVSDHSEKPENVVDVSDYPDMQELLCAADVLITDYSSSMWDYSLLKRPCFLFVPDMEEYIRTFGVLTPIETWPGIMARTNDELCEAIASFDGNAYRARIEQYHKDMGSYETGTACEQVCKRIAEICGVE